jgi:hypothetical protein
MLASAAPAHLPLAFMARPVMVTRKRCTVPQYRGPGRGFSSIHKICTNAFSPSMQSCITETISYDASQGSLSSTMSDILIRIGCNILVDGYTFYCDNPVAVAINTSGNGSSLTSGSNSRLGKFAWRFWL